MCNINNEILIIIIVILMCVKIVILLLMWNVCINESNDNVWNDINNYY